VSTVIVEELPRFSEIRPEDIEPRITGLIARNRQEIQRLVREIDEPTWADFVQPIEDLEDQLDRAWAPIRHLNGVLNSPELREAYNRCLPELTAYYAEKGQDQGLFRAFRAIAEGPEYERLDAVQQKVVDDALRDFRLAGIDLPQDQRERFLAIESELSDLSSRFEQNLLDATDAWTLAITDEKRLAGLPESVREMARETARSRDQEGWLFTLQAPSFIGVMTHAADRELRREIYEAFTTRASETGPHGGRWDNGPIMERILHLRQEKAQLLGFDDYADLSLATKMAESSDAVLGFLHDLAGRARPMADQEFAELTTFARETDGLETLEAWDVAFYAERLKQCRFDISQEDLKPYFPAERVIQGMFDIVGELFGLEIREREGVDVWHPDVRFFDIFDRKSVRRGSFYLDLYARENKRGGAWMDECISRRLTREGIQNPVAFLTCNATPPVADRPALLSFDEVTTLFHEFGHGLHHMLTQVDYRPVSGINGVEWDAVELPSQLLENWCWERQALDRIAGHYRTGDPLPEDLFAKLRDSRNFNAAMFMVRQLEFSLFDMRLHREFSANMAAADIQRIIDEVRDEVAVVQPPAFNRFQNGFAHIFAGGYAAGYYSYKWAEVLSADAFARFEEFDVFDRGIGEDFLGCILERGGSRPALELFREFRGREPSIDALLRHNGLIGDNSAHQPKIDA